MKQILRLAALSTVGLCALASVPMAEAALPQFVPSGTYAIRPAGGDAVVWLSNPLASNGSDWDPVSFTSDYNDAACAWRLNDEGGGYVSVRNTRGGVNSGDYIMKDSKIRLASTVNFVDYKNNQTFRFFGTESACVVMSNAQADRYWLPAATGLTLSYAVSTPDDATLFTLVPLYLHDELVAAVKGAREALDDEALQYDSSLRKVLEDCFADATALLSSPGYNEADAQSVLSALEAAKSEFVVSGKAPSANDLSALTKEERNSMEALSLDGVPSADDFLILRSDMVNLRELHLEETTLTELPDYACAGMSHLQKVFLPQGLRKIGNAAFMSCESLTEIVLPESVESVGALAFARSGLTVINIGAAVSHVGFSAFDECRSLLTITVSPGNEVYSAIDNVLFGSNGTEVVKCSPLKTGAISLPENVKSIAPYAFQGCRLLTGAIDFPSGLESIGDFAFADCVGLSGNLSFPCGLKSIGRYAFFGASGFSGAINLPVSIEYVGEGAFSYLPLNCSVSLPLSLGSIPKSCFECNQNISEIKSDGDVPPIVGDFALRGIDRNYTYINVPSSAVETWRNADIWCEFANYSAPFEGYDRFSLSGKYYIQCETDFIGYLTYNYDGLGLPPYFAIEKEDASVWSLDFFEVTSQSLPYSGGPGSDIRFAEGSSFLHVNMEGLCYSDPAAGYEQRDNRTFAFWLAPEQDNPKCPLVAIQGNGYMWGPDSAGSDELVASPFSSAYPLPSDFVFRLIPEDYTEESGIVEIDEKLEDAIFFDLHGHRINPAECSHGIYIMVTPDRVMKHKL